MNSKRLNWVSGSLVLSGLNSSLSPDGPLPAMQSPTGFYKVHSFHHGPIVLPLWSSLSSFLDFSPLVSSVTLGKRQEKTPTVRCFVLTLLSAPVRRAGHRASPTGWSQGVAHISDSLNHVF